MRKISLALLCSGLLACQASPLRPALQRPAASARPQGVTEGVTGSAYARLQTGPTLRFAIHFPQRAFQTQALNCNRFARAQVSVRGIGMTEALYPVGADPQQNHTVAVSGCSLEVSIPQVPSGRNRIAEIRMYNSGGSEIPATRLSAAFDISADPTTVYLNYRSSAVGEVIGHLLEAGETLLAAELDREALQAFFDGLTGASGDFPDEVYSTFHPLFLNSAAVAQDLITHAGDLSQLDPDPSAYRLLGSRVTGSVQGLVGNQTYTVALGDPISTPLTLPNGPFEFLLPAGSWDFSLNFPAGYSSSPDGLTLPFIVGAITTTEGQDVALGNVTLYPLRPTVTTLSVSSGVAGDTVLINGSGFHILPSANVVKFGDVEVPSENIQVNSLNQLEVIVPAAAVGATTVRVSIGGREALTTPAFVVLPPAPAEVSVSDVSQTAFQLSWEAVPEAETYRIYQDNVLVDNTSATTWNSLAGVVPDTAYGLQIAAVVNGQEGPRSPVTPVHTLSPTGWSRFATSASEKVLAIAAPVYPDTTALQYVYFGSDPQGTSEGGVWRCARADSNSCTQVYPAAGVPSIEEVGAIQALAVDPTQPNTLYAGSASQGVFVSTSQGDPGSWQPLNEGLTNLNVRALAVDPQEPDQLYVATADGVFHRSGSGPWVALSEGMDTRDLYALAIYRPSLAAAPILYAGSNGEGVYRHLGTGTWSTINTGLFGAGTGEGSVYLDGVKVSALVPHPVDASLLYGGGTGAYTLFFTWKVGIWKRTETGSVSNWGQIGRNASNGYCGQLSPIPHCSLDGQGGALSDTGLDSMQISALTIDPAQPSHLYTATTQDGAQTGGVYQSSDGGNSWQALGTAFTTAHALAAHPQFLYAGTNNGLYWLN
ncbi:MAG: IPT/TIG domain-containing protein [Candidatus Sericytochromatia bacterium]